MIAGYSHLGSSFLETPEAIAQSAARLRGFLNLMGLESICHPNWNRKVLDEEQTHQIESLVEVRLAARAAKNWKQSDRIRNELAAMGIVLKDNKDGTTTWEVKR